MPKISELTLDSSPSIDDVIPLVDSGTTKKATLGSLPVSTAVQTALDAKANTSSLGTMSTQNANNVAISGGNITGSTITGITDLAIADGGTGASTAAAARTNLGSTTVGDALFTAADTAAARTTLGLPSQVASIVRLHTANGYGSTNTAIRRFSTTLTNQGSDITYNDSATNGASFTINTTGVYSLSYSDVFTSAINIGFSVNSTQLTTSIATISAADRLCAISTAAADFIGNCATTVYLAAGTVVRPHGSPGSTTGTFPAQSQFTIVRIA